MEALFPGDRVDKEVLPHVAEKQTYPECAGLRMFWMLCLRAWLHVPLESAFFSTAKDKIAQVMAYSVKLPKFNFPSNLSKQMAKVSLSTPEGK